MKHVLGVAAAFGRGGSRISLLFCSLLNVKMRSTIEAAINHHHWSLTTLYTKDLPTDPTEKERKALLWDFMRFFNLWQDHELRLSAPSRSHPYASNFSMTTAVRLAEEAGVDVHANLMRLEDSTQLAIVDRQIDQLWEGKATWRGIPFIALLEDSTRMDTAGAVHLLDCRLEIIIKLRHVVRRLGIAPKLELEDETLAKCAALWLGFFEIGLHNLSRWQLLKVSEPVFDHASGAAFTEIEELSGGC